MSRSNLSDLAAFVVVARERSFTREKSERPGEGPASVPSILAGGGER